MTRTVALSLFAGLFCYLIQHGANVSSCCNVNAALLRTSGFLSIGLAFHLLAGKCRIKDGEIHRKDDGAKRLVCETFNSFSNAIMARDKATGMHCKRVASNSYFIGKQLGLGNSDLGKLYWAGLLHDIGKIGLADEVLIGTQKLTKSQRYMVRQHPTTGSNMLSFLPKDNSDIRMGILHHHEKWKGGGYPSGMSGVGIHLFGRIIAIADVFDALTSPRSYKESVSEAASLKFIRQKSGDLFDPVVVDAFLQAHKSGHITICTSRKTRHFNQPDIDNNLIHRLIP